MVTLSGTGTFRPVSPVVYIRVEEGFDACVDLHEKLQTGPLQRELPFSYHPHVTIAHDVAPESLDEAETVLESYKATFPVVSMGLYEHDADGIWQLREELDFGTETDDNGGTRGTKTDADANGATASH
jgi:2'-5' RNA ligase